MRRSVVRSNHVSEAVCHSPCTAVVSFGRARALLLGPLRSSNTLVAPVSKNRFQVKRPVVIGFLRLKSLAPAVPFTSTTGIPSLLGTSATLVVLTRTTVLPLTLPLITRRSDGEPGPPRLVSTASVLL